MGRKSLVSHPSFKTTRPKAGRIHTLWLTKLVLSTLSQSSEVLPQTHYSLALSLLECQTVYPASSAAAHAFVGRRQLKALSEKTSFIAPQFILCVVALIDPPEGRHFLHAAAFATNDRAEFEDLLARAVLYDLQSQAGLH